MHNLFRLASLASLEGQYRKYPRFDKELSQTYAKGLIATTGCPSGEVNRWLQVGQYDRALQAAADYRDILGPGNFFCELMEHGLEIERSTRDDLLQIAKTLDLPLLATNDLHYTHAADAEAHEVLLCVQTGKTLADPKRFRFDANDFYLKTAAGDAPHLARASRGVRQHAAHRRALRHVVHRGRRPHAPVPGPGRGVRGVVAGQGGRAGTRTPVRRRCHAVPDAHRAQATYEVCVVTQMGFPGYFLVVADLVRHAKENGIRVGPGRGSAAGSTISWALGITELDPIKHGLLFERFLNPERISMPDIDLDFDERRRGDMIRYATETYGEERVSQIITYGTIKAKAAVKDASRVLGYPFVMGERITKAMPPAVMGKDIPLSGIFDKSNERWAEAAEFRALYEADGDVKRVVDTARGHRGPQAPVGRARRRRHPLRRAAARRHPDPAPRAGRRDHHPARHGRLRGAGPAQDGLPRPAQPDGARRLPGAHQGQPRRRPSSSRTSTSTRTPRPMSCSAAARRSASSSSRAAACAPCFG